MVCSECFEDYGLKLLAEKIGISDLKECLNCKSSIGKKLSLEQLEFLVYRFFVIGSIIKLDFGASPIIQFNEHQKTSVFFNSKLDGDVTLFEKFLKIGFFYYGPRLWMIGEIEPLKDIQNKESRLSIFNRIIKEYPTKILNKDDIFYRIRVNPEFPSLKQQYDSPPKSGKGRLDSEKLNIFYGSQDLEICIHECRVTVEDEIYVATLKPLKDLKLIDLTELLEENCTEFESLDLSIQMLFLAGKHSYEITREMAIIIEEKGFDGIIYPSYFSLVRTGGVPFPTVYGISVRKLPNLKKEEKDNSIQNIALFGRPVLEKKVEVVNINKLGLNRIKYDYQFGPVMLD